MAQNIPKPVHFDLFQFLIGYHACSLSYCLRASFLFMVVSINF